MLLYANGSQVIIRKRGAIEVLDLFAYSSSCTLIIIAIGYFFEKRNRDDQIIVFSFCFLWAVITLCQLSNETGFYKKYPHLLYINEPFDLFLGPLVYYRFRILIEGKMRFNLLMILLFLPGVLALIYFIPFYMLSPIEKLAYAGFHNMPNGIVRGIYLLIVHGQTPLFIFCVVLFLVHGSRMLSAKGIRLLMQKKVLMAYNLIWILVAVTGYTFMLLEESLMLRVMIIITNYLIIFFYYIEKKYSGFFLSMQIDSSETKYKRSMLSGIDTVAVVERISQLIELEKIYLNEDLSLQSLSSRLGISPHQLSEILNNMLQTNFRSFINRFRIDAAKKMFQENKDISILRAVYDCGFKSKNAFNTAFNKQEGITPTEFRKKISHGL